MPTDYAAFYDKWHADRGHLRKETPDLSDGFSAFYRSVMKDGSLTLRDKELIALALSVAMRCEPCINLHARGCLKAGASREQVLEAAAVAAIMQGGPAFTYVPKVVDVLDYLESEQAN